MTAKGSIWTKEIHLRRPRDPNAPLADSEQPTSIWKKEIHLGRRPAAPPAMSVSQDAPPPEPAAHWATPRAAEHWVEPLGEDSTDTESLIPAPLVALAPADAEAASLWAAPAEPPVPWFEAEPEPVESVVLAPEPDREPAPAALPEPTPEPEPEPEPELAPAAEAPAPVAAKPSIWKRELGPRRSSSPKPAKQPKPPKAERAPKPEKEPKPPRQPKEAKAPKPAKAPRPPREAKQPLLKRELRLSRPKKQRPTEPAADAHAVVTLVGLHIGSSQISAAVVHNNGSAELRRLARSPLAPDVVAGGEVRDGDALAKALKRFFSEHKLPRSGVRIGVATNRIGVRVLEVPALDDPKQQQNAIRFRAQEVLPIPLAEAVFDHVVLGEHEGERGAKELRVLIVFAHRELVDSYTAAAKRAGLKLAGVDLDAFAVLRALQDPAASAGNGAAVVAVSIGHDRTVFAVSDGSVCDYTRVLDWGGASLDNALAVALEITPGEAEEVKKALAGSVEPPAGAREALHHELEVLARELVASLEFYQSRPGSLDIGEVLLTGGGAELDGIEAELGRLLGIRVRKGRPLARVTLGDKVSVPFETGSLAIAVGLGIEA